MGVKENVYQRGGNLSGRRAGDRWRWATGRRRGAAQLLLQAIGRGDEDIMRSNAQVKCVIVR